MDFTIPPHVQDLTHRVRQFVDSEVIPLENFIDDHQDGLPLICCATCAPKPKPPDCGVRSFRRSLAD